MEYVKHWWNDSDSGKMKKIVEEKISVSVCPPQILQLLTCDQARVSAVTNQRLTALGTTSNKKKILHTNTFVPVYPMKA